jgi:hypothetical protein
MKIQNKSDDSIEPDLIKKPTLYRLYPKRYVMLFLFTMAELCNTAVYATCNPIAIEV